MDQNTVQVKKEGGLLVITINRPEKLNALNEAVLSGLEEAVQQLENDPTVFGALITGAGEKAFVAGADIASFLQHDRTKGASLALRGQAVFASIETSTKPIIAAVNGFALGGGCELAMSCHFRIASEHARFGQPEINLGIIPGYGGTQRLARLVGKGMAMELMMTGEMIDAQEAYRIGLVNQVCKPVDLHETALKKLQTISSKPSFALAQLIEAVNKADGDPGAGFATEAQCFGRCFARDEMTKGVTAFLEKRKPNFKQ